MGQPAIWTTLTARNYKYKWFVQSEFLDLNWHFNSCVWEEEIFITYICTHICRFMYKFYTKPFPLSYYLKYWDSNPIPFSIWDNRLLWFEDIFKYKTNYPISLPINSISISEPASVACLLAVPCIMACLQSSLKSQQRQGSKKNKLFNLLGGFGNAAIFP